MVTNNKGIWNRESVPRFSALNGNGCSVVSPHEQVSLSEFRESATLWPPYKQIGYSRGRKKQYRLRRKLTTKEASNTQISLW
jgi:hypothetical protein